MEDEEESAAGASSTCAVREGVPLDDAVIDDVAVPEGDAEVEGEDVTGGDPEGVGRLDPVSDGVGRLDGVSDGVGEFDGVGPTSCTPFWSTTLTVVRLGAAGGREELCRANTYAGTSAAHVGKVALTNDLLYAGVDAIALVLDLNAYQFVTISSPANGVTVGVREGVGAEVPLLERVIAEDLVCDGVCWDVRVLDAVTCEEPVLVLVTPPVMVLPGLLVIVLELDTVPV